MRVDSIDVPMDMYFYNLCYAASYMESYMNMYGMDLEHGAAGGETVLDVTKDSILENTKELCRHREAGAGEQRHRLDEAALSELEANARRPSSLGGEESYRRARQAGSE